MIFKMTTMLFLVYMHTYPHIHWYVYACVHTQIYPCQINACMNWDYYSSLTLRRRHNGHDSVSNHQPHDCLLKRLLRRRSQKTSWKSPRHWPICAGNSPGTDEFPAQMASNAETVFIWWRHHEVWIIHNKRFQLLVSISDIKLTIYVIFQRIPGMMRTSLL